MAPVTTLAEVRTLLGWQDVTEAAYPECRVFSAWPSGKWLPPIELVLDVAAGELYQLNFGPWHAHFEGGPDERANVLSAIAAARDLVAGTRCLVVQRSDDGRYLGAVLCRRDESPASIPATCRRLERVVFGEPPQDVPVGPTTARAAR